MSSSSRAITVLLGADTARRANAILAEMGDRSRQTYARRVRARETELTRRGIKQPTRAAALLARADAIERYVPRTHRLALERAIESIEQGADSHEVEQVFALAEQEAHDRMGRLAEQRAALEHLVAGLQGARQLTEQDFLASEDGVLRLNTKNSVGGRIPITVLSSEAGRHRLRIDLQESHIDTLVTDHGTVQGCDARDEYVRRLVENGRANGLTVSIEEDSPTPGAGEPKEAAASSTR